jgi:hypothetical protein
MKMIAFTLFDRIIEMTNIQTDVKNITNKPCFDNKIIQIISGLTTLSILCDTKITSNCFET